MANNGVLNLTASQTEALKELSRRMAEETIEEIKICDDTNLLYRFLKARDFDVDKAETMLKKCLQWRRQNDPLIRNYKPPEVLKNYFANLHIGYDKEGCPILYVPGGKYDAKGIHMAAKYSDIEKSLHQIFKIHENHLENSQKGSGRITKFLIIFNESGLTFANTINKNGLETCIRLAKIQQDVFPERLKAVIFINAPSYFTVGYNVAKNFLSTETQKKFHVYGTDGWQDELLRLIDADQLPKFMGGTRTDPDGNPLCKTILNQGGIIHESYFIHKSKNPLSKSPGVKKLHVSRWSSAKIPFEVTEAGSVIEWEFETRSGDIVFGINYKGERDMDMTEALPLQRLNTKDFAEIGMYKCEKPGDYVVLFDNSYSWFRSKEIYYRIKVVRTNELEDQINGS